MMNKVTALIALSLLSAVLVSVPDVHAQAAGSQPPQTGTLTVREPDSKSDGWKRINHWYKPGGYWRTSKSNASATWWFGDVQGVFKFRRLLLGDDSHNGTMKWQIYHRPHGQQSYRLVKTYNPIAQTDRQGWSGYSSRLHFDGRVKVVATRLSGTVAIDDVRLLQVDVLPIHVEMAKDMCKQGVVHALSVTLIGVTAVAAAVVVKYAGVAALTRAAAKSLINDAKLLVSNPPAYFTIERAKDIVLDKLKEVGLEIWNDAVDSYQQECNRFHANFPVPGFVRGYSIWANDIAETMMR